MGLSTSSECCHRTPQAGGLDSRHAYVPLLETGKCRDAGFLNFWWEPTAWLIKLVFPCVLPAERYFVPSPPFSSYTVVSPTRKVTSKDPTQP